MAANLPSWYHEMIAIEERHKYIQGFFYDPYALKLLSKFLLMFSILLRRNMHRNDRLVQAARDFMSLIRTPNWSIDMKEEFESLMDPVRKLRISSYRLTVLSPVPRVYWCRRQRI